MVGHGAQRSCRRFVVSGRVQGVYYRASAYDIARHLGLTGWVRNLPDGNVEALACGDAAALEEFEQWLRQGPPNARVQGVVATDVAPQEFADFGVR